MAAAQQLGGFVFVAVTGFTFRTPLQARRATALPVGATIAGGPKRVIARTPLPEVRHAAWSQRSARLTVSGSPNAADGFSGLG